MRMFSFTSSSLVLAVLIGFLLCFVLVAVVVGVTCLSSAEGHLPYACGLIEFTVRFQCYTDAIIFIVVFIMELLSLEL